MLKTKVEITEIFKNGENFEFKKVDYTENTIKTEISEITERQEKILKMADADIGSIKDMVFDI